MTQRIIPIESPLFVREQSLEPGQDIRTLFPRETHLALEIGCGTGDFLVEQARRRPDVNFIGADIYNKGCYKTCRKADMAAMTHIRVLRMEACHLLTNHIPRESLDTVYINCPDPWPKKRHRRRRLVNVHFLKLLSYGMKPNGRFYFCTDFEDYALDVATLFPLPGFLNMLPQPFVHELEDYPASKYMQRFREAGLPLYYMVQRRDPDYQPEVSAPPPVPSPFRRSRRNEEP